MQPIWITNDTARPFYARTRAEIRGKAVSAVAEVCGLGQFNFYINGQKVGDHVLDPGWTDYNKLVQFVTFDVISLLWEGENVLAAEVGNGWYHLDEEGYVFHFPKFAPPNPNPYRPFGPCLVLAAEVKITYAAAVAAAAANAGLRVHLQLPVMIGGQHVAAPGQVVIFVHQADLDPFGAGLAMGAVDAATDGVLRESAADDRVIFFLGRGIKGIQQEIEISQASYSRQNRENARAVEGVLQELRNGKLESKGGQLRGKQLSSVEGLHYGDPHTLRLTAFQQPPTGADGADAQFVAFFQIVRRIQGEHHHAHKLCVQQHFGHLRIVGGKADVPNRGFFLQGANVIQHAAFYQVFHVLFLVHAVQKAHVNIIGAQLHQFPIEGLLNFRQVPAPAVFALFVICRAETQSEKHLVLG